MNRFLTLVVVTACLAAAAVAQPPPRRGASPPDLVELAGFDPTIRLDIRYATTRNLLGRPVYAEARAFLQRPAAESLAAAARDLRARGYGILVFDGYRPWRVTKLFWDGTPRRAHTYLADPAKGSRHNRGCAVDCTLFDLRTGAEVRMPSPYDELSRRASPRYAGGTRAERTMRDLLRAAMERHGFTVDGGEWWHFDHAAWRSYDVLDIPFEELPPPAR